MEIQKINKVLVYNEMRFFKLKRMRLESLSVSFVVLMTVVVIMMSSTSCGNSKEKSTSYNKMLEENPQEKIIGIAENLSNQLKGSEDYHEGLISFSENNKFGFKDSNNNVVIPARYENVGCFNEGLVSVSINGKMGYINHNGDMVVPAQYDFTNFFSNGLAVVCKNDKWGYINKKGEIVIDLIYDRAHDFWDPNGFASVRKNGKEGLIDIKGNIVVPIEFEHTSSTQNGVAHVFEGNSEMEVYNDKSYKVITY